VTIRVLLVDDHAMLRDGLRALLKTHKDIDVAGEADNGLTAIDLVRELLPDIVVMDVAMPNMNGLEATRRIKKLHPSCRILVLTQYDHREYILPILEAGADGYILKKSAGEQLVAAIRAVCAGKSILDPVVARTVIEAYVGRKSLADEDNEAGPLTNREREVLILIAEGYTNREIAQMLHISPKTVDVHRTNIMQKLGLHNRTELIKYAIRKGLVNIRENP
jgi:DNA-binding NarL/FixJ family response regulator